MDHIVIIGNGIAGVTAARHIRKNSDKRITIISGESDYFFARTALMYVYMGHMKFEHTQPSETNPDMRFSCQADEQDSRADTRTTCR